MVRRPNRPWRRDRRVGHHPHSQRERGAAADAQIAREVGLPFVPRLPAGPGVHAEAANAVGVRHRLPREGADDGAHPVELGMAQTAVLDGELNRTGEIVLAERGADEPRPLHGIGLRGAVSAEHERGGMLQDPARAVGSSEPDPASGEPEACLRLEVEVQHLSEAVGRSSELPLRQESVTIGHQPTIDSWRRDQRHRRPLGQGVLNDESRERVALDDALTGLQRSPQLVPLSQLVAVLDRMPTMGQLLPGERDALKHIGIVEEERNLADDVVVVGEDAALHVDETGRLDRDRPLGQQQGPRGGYSRCLRTRSSAIVPHVGTISAALSVRA